MNLAKKRRKDKVAVGGKGKYRTRDMVADRPKSADDDIVEQPDEESEPCPTPQQMEG